MIRSQILAVIALLMITTSSAWSQTESEMEANYAKRIKEEVLFGVYIPADLEDAHRELERLSDAQGRLEFKSAPEEAIRRKLHFGFGRWILANWGLEEGSRISHHLRQKGISIPDDMVRVIIVTWHRRLNGKPLQLEDEIAIISKRMAEEKAKRDADRKVTVIEKRPHKG